MLNTPIHILEINSTNTEIFYINTLLPFEQLSAAKKYSNRTKIRNHNPQRAYIDFEFKPPLLSTGLFLSNAQPTRI